MWAQNLSEQQYHKAWYTPDNKRLRFVILLNLNKILCKCKIRMKKKTQSRNTTFNNNNKGSMQMLRWVHVHSMYIFPFLLPVILCFFSVCFFFIHCCWCCCYCWLLLVYSGLYIPSQQDHEIDTLKHIESSDEAARTNDLKLHSLLCCVLLGQVKLILIVYA